MNWPASASRLASATLFSAALLLTAGCEDANDLGVDLPGTNSIGTEYKDLSVTASTILVDSLETLKSARFLGGRVYDNNLGTTTEAKAFLNLQVFAVDSLPGKFTDVVLDSVVMSLGFDQVYGSSTQPVRFDVYDLQQKLDERSTYNSVTSVALGNALGTNLISSLNRTKIEQQANGLKTKKAPVTDSTTAVVVPDQTVRLRLAGPGQSPAFISAVFNALKNENFNQTQLDALWKGVAILPSTGYTGTAVGFNRSNESRINFYYRGNTTNTAGTKKPRTRVYSIFFGNRPLSRTTGVFGLPSDARYFTQITPAVGATGPFAKLVNQQESVPSSATGNVTYMQEGTGFSTKLVVQGLEELRNKTGLSINRAELIVPVKPYSNGVFPYPVSAYLYEADNATNRILQRVNGISREDRVVPTNNLDTRGNPVTRIALIPVSSSSSYYSAIITSYVQQYLSSNNTLGTLPTAFILSPTLRSSPELGLGRAVLDANNIKLRVYYSELR